MSVYVNNRHVPHGCCLFELTEPASNSILHPLACLSIQTILCIAPETGSTITLWGWFPKEAQIISQQKSWLRRRQRSAHQRLLAREDGGGENVVSLGNRLVAVVIGASGQLIHSLIMSTIVNPLCQSAPTTDWSGACFSSAFMRTYRPYGRICCH